MSQFMLIISQQLLAVHNYSRPKVPSFSTDLAVYKLENNHQLRIIAAFCRSYCDNL